MTAVSPCSEIPSNPVSLFITGSPVAVFSFTVSPFWSRAVVRHEFQIAPPSLTPADYSLGLRWETLGLRWEMSHPHWPPT